MKNMHNSEINQNNPEDLIPEYNFDYSQARPNRFAAKNVDKKITVTLDSDIAEVFKTSEDVNNALRAILASIPNQQG